MAKNKIFVRGYVNFFEEVKINDTDHTYVTLSLNSKRYLGKDDKGNSQFMPQYFKVKLLGTLAKRALRAGVKDGFEIEVVGPLYYDEYEKNGEKIKTERFVEAEDFEIIKWGTLAQK